MGSTTLPYDPTEGTPLPCLIVNDHTALAVMPVQQLLALVPDPVASEDPRRTESDPTLKEYAELRAEVQRLVEGAKKKNADKYTQYLLEGLDGQRPTMTPPITLYHPEQLEVVELAPGLSALMLPFGDFLVAIDGETQRIARQRTALTRHDALVERVGVVIHHGKNVAEARQGFYDLNTREVKPNAAVAISMDTMDPASQITRSLIERSPILRARVNLRRRQLRTRDSELVTISALRTGVVTTILGVAGLQTGSRPIDLPDGVVRDTLDQEVVEAWCAIVESIEDDLASERRAETVVSAPAILAGIGVVAHHTVSSPPRSPDIESWSIERMTDLLSDVCWSRYADEWDDEDTPASSWEGIAGKRTSTGRLSIGGPKEFGHTVARAIERPESPEGQRIRLA
jgi:DNA sulfur modification protein DndB